MTVTHGLAKIAAALLGTVVLTVAGAGTAGAAVPAARPAATAVVSAASQTSGLLVLAPTSIESFEWVQGQQSWVQPNLNRLARTVFQIDSAGNFAMIQPDGYPTLIGTVGPDGTFQARASSSVGSTGSTQVEVIGQLLADADTVVMRLTYASGASTAAVINGTAFGESRVKAYHATLVLGAVPA